VAAALADSAPEVATAGFEERVVDDSEEAEEKSQLVRFCMIEMEIQRYWIT